MITNDQITFLLFYKEKKLCSNKQIMSCHCCMRPSIAHRLKGHYIILPLLWWKANLASMLSRTEN